MNQKERFIVLLIVLFTWTAFLFADAFFSTHSFVQKISHASAENVVSDHVSTDEIKKENLALEQSKSTISGNLQNNIKNPKKYIMEDSNKSNMRLETKPKTPLISGLDLNDISLLEKSYQDTKSSKILKILIQKLVENYQFDKAKQYIADINIFQNDVVDAKTYIYTYINSLSIIDDNDMTRFMSFIEQMRYKSLISSDDYVFYQ